MNSVIEIISDSWHQKDALRLPAVYQAAGVKEYWLVDARGQQLFFHINRLATNVYQPTDVDDNGFQHSAVLECGYRLQRLRGRRGCWKYTLETRPL